ncbi:MAG: chlorophyll a/b-binding protein [Leptolyngbyaceae cyanobacterium bins.302]|nr:chlorophyll a/b-binding protein [Leptolyngbyaceae cyanobacterium bins.302]
MSESPKSENPQPSRPQPEPPKVNSSAFNNRPEPGFGWTSYAEQLNGRFAMIGIVALILIEVVTGQGLIAWLGF